MLCFMLKLYVDCHCFDIYVLSHAVVVMSAWGAVCPLLDHLSKGGDEL